jgi:hypothetical protein
VLANVAKISANGQLKLGAVRGDTYRDRTLRDMTKITARRILLLFGVLAAIFIAFGLATAGRDPLQRTYGEAGRELETAMDRLSDVAIGCSTEIVAAVEMGGASVGCTTPQAIRVALVAFGDVRTRDRAAAFPCRPLGGPVIMPRGTPWLIETYSYLEAESVRRELQRAGIALATPPRCEDGISLLPSETPG